MKLTIKPVFGLALLIFSVKSYALAQDEGLWLAVNAAQTLSANKKWNSFIFSQFRFINQSHPWRSGLLEAGLGYQFQPAASFWVGYRLTGRDPFNGFSQENRLFQQFVWLYNEGKNKSIVLRSRLEELERTNQSQVAIRFRQRVAIEFLTGVFTQYIFPFAFDEIIFQLRKTNYTTTNTLSENRLFLGFNLYPAKGTWWEIGYMNQLIFNQSNSGQTQMNHIFSITYSFS